MEACLISAHLRIYTLHQTRTYVYTLSGVYVAAASPGVGSYDLSAILTYLLTLSSLQVVAVSSYSKKIAAN